MNEAGELFFAHVFSWIWIREIRGWSELELTMAVSPAREFEKIIVGWAMKGGLERICCYVR